MPPLLMGTSLEKEEEIFLSRLVLGEREGGRKRGQLRVFERPPSFFFQRRRVINHSGVGKDACVFYCVQRGEQSQALSALRRLRV